MKPAGVEEEWVEEEEVVVVVVVVAVMVESGSTHLPGMIRKYWFNKIIVS